MATKYILKSKIIYGIGIVDEGDTDHNSIFIHDKTEKEISDFIDLCNKEKVEPIHLHDTISDILY